MFRTLVRTSFLSLLLGIIFFWSAANSTFAATFTVDDLGDGIDPVPGDGICGPPCTLRAAIMEANAFAGTDSITFSVSGSVVLGGVLPTITENVSISGSMAPGALPPDGPAQGGANEAANSYVNTVNIVGGGFTTLTISGAGASLTSVTGLNFVTYATAIAVIDADFVFIARNHFGSDHTNTPTGSNGIGVEVISGIGTFIGQPGGEGGNIFNQNSTAGIRISGGATASIFQNTIGTGLLMSEVTVGGARNTVGIIIAGGTGTRVHENRIVNSVSHGVLQTGGAGSSIQGNKIGILIGYTNGSNGGDGINITASAALPENFIGTELDTINDAAEGNFIGFNLGHGIRADGFTFAGAIVITSNYIGVGPANEDLGNSLSGIRTFGNGGRIGSAIMDLLERNYVSNNDVNGIFLSDGSNGWEVRNNYVGMNPDGTCSSSGGIVGGGDIGGAPGVFSNTIDINFIGVNPTADGALLFENMGADNTVIRNNIGRTPLGGLCAVSVGLSIDATVGAGNVVGGSAINGNFFDGATVDHHIHGGVTAGTVAYSFNTHGLFYSNALNNLTIRGAKGVTVTDNTFHPTSTPGAHIAIFAEGGESQNHTIKNNNYIDSIDLSAASIAIDLDADGPTANNGDFPAPTESQEGVDTPVITGTLDTAVTGTANPGAEVHFSRVFNTLAGLRGMSTLLGTVVANGAGDFTFNATLFGLVAGDIVVANQTEALGGNSSEFGTPVTLTAVPPPPPPPGGGGGRRAVENTNVLVVRDGIGKIGEPFDLIRGVDEEASNSDDFTDLNYASIELPKVDVINPDRPLQERDQGVTASLMRFFANIGNYLTAMIWDQPEPLQVAAFTGSGSKTYFIPPAAGVYKFSVTADYSSGTPNPITMEFKVNVLEDSETPDVPLKPSAEVTAIGSSVAPCQYTYLDFLGVLVFSKYDGSIFDSQMICIIRPIISGLVTDRMLGSYRNLIRGHSTLAVLRTYLDPAGVYTILAENPNYGTDFEDISDDDGHKKDYGRIATGYSLDDALRNIQYSDVEESERNYIITRLKYLVETGQTTDTKRYFFAYSPIRKIDLLIMIDKTLGISKLFGPYEGDLPVDSEYQDPKYRDTLGALFGLGIVRDLSELSKPISRDKVFTIFYRLQQLNHLLKEEFDNQGFTYVKDVIRFDGEILTRVKALQLFQKNMREEGLDYEIWNQILEESTVEAITEFWESWQDFTSRDQESPYRELLNIAGKKQGTYETADELKAFLDEYDSSQQLSPANR